MSENPGTGSGAQAFGSPEIQRILTSDPAAAEARAREVLHEHPDDPDALLLLGSALRRLGHARAARSILESLVRSRPSLSVARMELGLALAAAGDNSAATAALRRAVQIDPENREAWRALGDQFKRIQHPKGAAAAFAKQFEPGPEHPELGEAASALRRGDAKAADEILCGFIGRHPDDVNALKLSAEALLQLGQPAEAEAQLHKCLAIAPEFRAAQYRLAVALSEQMKLDGALAHTDSLLEHEPDNFEYRLLKAVVLVRMSEFDAAAAEYEALLARTPNRPGAWVAYGHLLKALGRRDECVAAYRKGAGLLPIRASEAYLALASVKSFRFEPAECDAIRDLLARPDVRGQGRARLLFALGKALEDSKDYPASFDTYRDANAVFRFGLQYHPDKMTEFVHRTREGFTPDLLRERAGSGCDVAGPIFIVGLPRSGSLLVEQILATHSRIEGTTELGAMGEIAQLAARMVDGSSSAPEALRRLDRDQLRFLGETYLERVGPRRKLGRRFFVDKRPENFRHAGLIHLLLPNARIVDVRRHPMACCFSNFKHHHASRPRLFAYSFGDLARYYSDYVDLMAHYDEVLPGRVHRINYEDLVDDPEREIRRLFAYLGLEFEERTLRFYANPRPVHGTAAEEVRMPIFRDSLEQWRNYERWLDPLKSALGYVADAYPAVPKSVDRLHLSVQSRASWSVDQDMRIGPVTQTTPLSFRTSGTA
jgi:tetratricopeptide (TPR) repeat protein